MQLLGCEVGSAGGVPWSCPAQFCLEAVLGSVTLPGSMRDSPGQSLWPAHQLAVVLQGCSPVCQLELFCPFEAQGAVFKQEKSSYSLKSYPELVLSNSFIVRRSTVIFCMDFSLERRARYIMWLDLMVFIWMLLYLSWRSCSQSALVSCD